MRRATARSSAVGGPREGPLQLDRGVEARVGAVEGREEAVALELEELAVVMREHMLDERVVVAQQLLPALGTKVVGQGARVGDVAEHQRDRSVRRAEAPEIR